MIEFEKYMRKMLETEVDIEGFDISFNVIELHEAHMALTKHIIDMEDSEMELDIVEDAKNAKEKIKKIKQELISQNRERIINKIEESSE